MAEKLEPGDVLFGKQFTKKAEVISRREADRLGIGQFATRGTDNARDAFRHAYTSALAVQNFRQAKASADSIGGGNLPIDKGDGSVVGRLGVTSYGIFREIRGDNTPVLVVWMCLIMTLVSALVPLFPLTQVNEKWQIVSKQHWIVVS